MTLPPRPPVDDEHIEPEESKIGMKFSGYTIYAVMLVIALIVSVGINYFMGVTKADLTTHKEEIVALVASVQSDLRATKDSVKTALDNLPSTIDSKVSSSLNSVNSRLSALEDSVQSANNTANSATNQIGSITSQITAIKTELQNLKDGSNLSGVTTAINNALTKISDLEVNLAALTTEVGELSVVVPTTTPTTTPTTVVNKVTALIEGNIFTGSTAIDIGVIPAGETISKVLAYSVNNETGKDLTSLKLALAVQTVVGNTFYTLPANVKVTVASENLGVIWAAQTTGIPYIKGFVSGIASGFSSYFGSTTVAPGITPYNITITVANEGATDTTSLMLYPLISVVSFK